MLILFQNFHAQIIMSFDDDDDDALQSILLSMAITLKTQGSKKLFQK